jgi:hypothetical protein
MSDGSVSLTPFVGGAVDRILGDWECGSRSAKGAGGESDDQGGSEHAKHTLTTGFVLTGSLDANE